MTKEEKDKLKKFMYWLADYEDWENIKTIQLLAEYEAYLDGKS
jgi:hypothetical protein